MKIQVDTIGLKGILILAVVASLFLLLWLATQTSDNPQEFTQELTQQDIRYLRRFTLNNLPPLPSSPDNAYANDLAAAKLGQAIFFDIGFSRNSKVSCASCHQPQRYFTDGLTLGRGVAQTRRNTPSLLGASYGPWKYWDGRKDSLWAQALEPLEHPNEHGFSRKQVSQRIASHYRSAYEAIFGSLNSGQPDSETRIFVNVGKALMAYQRQLKLLPSRFDKLIAALQAGKAGIDFSESELKGLRLFMGKAACASCHNGPLFTNFEFHNVGAPEPNKKRVDLGRYNGIEQLRQDEFNCLSVWSDAHKSQCEELNYLKTQGPELVGAFKTPSLRNVAQTAPYMQAGQLATLEDVVAHYNEPIPPFYDRAQHPDRPHFDILPLGLSDEEQENLIAFLHTLTSPLPRDDSWWFKP